MTNASIELSKRTPVASGSVVADWFDEEKADIPLEEAARENAEDSHQGSETYDRVDPSGGGGDFDGDDGGDSCYSYSDHSEGIALLRTSLETELVDADDTGTSVSHPLVCSQIASHLCKAWTTHWLGPDTEWTLRGHPTTVLLDAAGTKLVKFGFVTGGCLVAVHTYARLVGDKHDPTYGLHELLVYDGTSIATDCIVFFVVGRMHSESAAAVDTLEFVVPVLGAALLQSWGATHLTNLQHSITPKELRCDWTWPMYLLVVGGCLPLLAGLVWAHAREAHAKNCGLRRFVEFAGCILVFWVLPYGLLAGSTIRSFFHLHHWYYAWLFGMHCSASDRWWSRLARNVFWGIYVNGVAIFGRDPVLGCALALYRVQSQPACSAPFAAEGRGYGNYTLADLGSDLGMVAAAAAGGDAGSPPDICELDVTRWRWRF